MELILGAMIVALWVKALPAAMVDMVTMLRASKAGEWGLIDKERDRKHARSEGRREAMSKAWGTVRSDRNRKAGGDGTYRPGAKAYVGDLYHGFWEDKLAQRTADRAARPAPSARRSRMDAAVEAKVGRQREKTGLFGRAARLLLDPVGEKRQPADVAPPRSDGRGDGGGVYGRPSDPWAPAGGGDDPTLDLGGGHLDGPRYACPVCGDTLTRSGDSWRHPIGSSRCASAGEPSPPQPATPGAASPLEGQVRATAREAMAKADPAGEGGPEKRDAAFADVYNAHPGVDMDLIDNALMQADQDNRRRAAGDKQNSEGTSPGCTICGQSAFAEPWCEHRQAAYQNMSDTIRQALGDDPPDGGGENNTDNETTDPTSNGGTTMTDNSDLLAYNQAVAEHEAALAHLGAQRAEADAFKQHLTGSTANVESMDAGRVAVTQALAPLAEGMEGSRFGADASSGSAEAAGALSAGSIAAVQEHIEAATATNDAWIGELDSSIEAVQASMQSLQSTYGEAAATVQETGVDARALEER